MEYYWGQNGRWNWVAPTKREWLLQARRLVFYEDLKWTTNNRETCRSLVHCHFEPFQYQIPDCRASIYTRLVYSMQSETLLLISMLYQYNYYSNLVSSNLILLISPMIQPLKIVVIYSIISRCLLQRLNIYTETKSVNCLQILYTSLFS